MFRTHSLRRAGGVAFLITASIFSAPAKAQDFFRGITNMVGITAAEQDDIEYRERAPLVVPPETNRLRHPEAPVAQRNARWPVDPDSAEHKKAASKAPRVGNLQDNGGEISQGAPIPGQQMRAYGRLAKTESTSREPVSKPDEIRDYWIDPRVLSAMRVKEEAPLAPGVEPPRRGLTDPPTGARLPAAGAPIRATADPKGPNLLDDGVNGVREYQRQAAQP